MSQITTFETQESGEPQDFQPKLIGDFIQSFVEPYPLIPHEVLPIISELKNEDFTPGDPNIPLLPGQYLDFGNKLVYRTALASVVCNLDLELTMDSIDISFCNPNDNALEKNIYNSEGLSILCSDTGAFSITLARHLDITEDVTGIEHITIYNRKNMLKGVKVKQPRTIFIPTKSTVSSPNGNFISINDQFATLVTLSSLGELQRRDIRKVNMRHGMEKNITEIYNELQQEEISGCITRNRVRYKDFQTLPAEVEIKPVQIWRGSQENEVDNYIAIIFDENDSNRIACVNYSNGFGRNFKLFPQNFDIQPLPGDPDYQKLTVFLSDDVLFNLELIVDPMWFIVSFQEVLKEK